MGAIASQITSLAIVYSIVYSGADQSKHQSSMSLAFVWGIHRGPVNSPHKWPVTRKIFPFDDVIMVSNLSIHLSYTKNIILPVWYIHDDIVTWNCFPPDYDVMEALSALLSLWAENPPVNVEFPHKGTVTRIFVVRLLLVCVNCWKKNTRLTVNSKRHDGHLTSP